MRRKKRGLNLCNKILWRCVMTKTDLPVLAVVCGGGFSLKFNQKCTPARISFRGDHKPKKIL
jgi:hypothetical protein